MSALISPDGDTHYVEALQKISALLPQGEGCRYFVTSTHWGEIARELVVKYASQIPPSTQNFKRLKIGANLLVLNAGTEDAEVVNHLNEAEAARVEFQARRERLVSGRA